MKCILAFQHRAVRQASFLQFSSVSRHFGRCAQFPEKRAAMDAHHACMDAHHACKQLQLAPSRLTSSCTYCDATPAVFQGTHFLFSSHVSASCSSEACACKSLTPSSIRVSRQTSKATGLTQNLGSKRTSICSQVVTDFVAASVPAAASKIASDIRARSCPPVHRIQFPWGI